MANKKNNKPKDKKSGAFMHGRRVATWKIVLASVIVLLVALVATLCIFIQTYVPNVDSNPHFADMDYDKDFSLTYREGMYKYNMSRALESFGESVKQRLRKITAEEMKREEGVYNFLLLGHDKVALNTDVIMIANFDTNDGSINIMQLPRDTYIEYDGYSHKINSMFAYFVSRARSNGAENVYQTALSDYCELLENAMSIELDNYALINLEAFSNIVDIVGGVPLDVPADMDYDDSIQGLSIHIKKGYQVLDGETAAGFVRFRSGYVQADIGRQNAQKLFMTAFLKRVQETFSVNTIAKIAEQALKNVTTDLTLSDAVYYAKSALSVDLGNMNMMTLPGKAVYANGVSYYVIYRDSTLDIINNYFNVYNSDIPDEMFDRNLFFTDGRSTAIDSIYRSDESEYVVNNAESVDENGIYIPRVNGSSNISNTQTQTVKNETVVLDKAVSDAPNADTSDSETAISETADITETDTYLSDDVEATSDFDTEEEPEVSEESETDSESTGFAYEDTVEADTTVDDTVSDISSDGEETLETELEETVEDIIDEE